MKIYRIEDREDRLGPWSSANRAMREICGCPSTHHRPPNEEDYSVLTQLEKHWPDRIRFGFISYRAMRQVWDYDDLVHMIKSGFRIRVVDAEVYRVFDDNLQVIFVD